MGALFLKISWCRRREVGSCGYIWWRYHHTALFPGLPTVQVLTTYSMQELDSEKACESGHIAIVQTAIMAEVIFSLVPKLILVSFPDHWGESGNETKYKQERVWIWGYVPGSMRQTSDTCLRWGLEEVFFSSSGALVLPLLQLYFQYHQLWHAHQLLSARHTQYAWESSLAIINCCTMYTQYGTKEFRNTSVHWARCVCAQLVLFPGFPHKAGAE